MNFLKYLAIISLLLFTQACKTGSKVATTSGSKGMDKKPVDEKQVNIQYNYYNAVKEKLLGNNDKAIELYSQVLRDDPGNHAAMYELASIYIEKNKVNDALHFSKSAAELNPENDWYQLQLAEIYGKTNQPKEAISIFEKLSKKHPERPDYLFQWADALLYAGKPMEAIKVYDKLENSIGKSKELTVQKERIYLRLGKIDLAAEEIEKYIKENPTDGDGYTLLIDMYLANNLGEKAMETIQRLKAVDPSNPRIALSMAEYYRSKGENEKSFDELKKAFASPQLNSDIMLQILTSYLPLVQDKPDMLNQALELCKIMSETHPGEASAHAVHGDFLSIAKKYTEARGEYREALALDGKNMPAWTQLLIIESELRDFVSMEKEADAALELYPDQSVFYLFSGIAKSQNNKPEAAIKVLVSGSKLVVDNDAQLVQFYSNLGDIYNKQKEYTSSDSYFEKALKINAIDATILNNYAYYLSVRNVQLEKAESMSKKSNELVPEQSSYEDTYAWILYKQGNYKDAKVWIDKAIASGAEGNGTILEHCGDIVYKLGQTEEAMKYWIKAKATGDHTELLDKKITDRKLYE